MTDIVDRLKFDAARCETTYSKGIASNIEEAVAEIERLRALAKEQHDALDMMVTWMPSGFAPQSQGEAMRMANNAMKKYRALEQGAPK